MANKLPHEGAVFEEETFIQSLTGKSMFNVNNNLVKLFFPIQLQKPCC